MILLVIYGSIRERSDWFEWDSFFIPELACVSDLKWGGSLMVYVLSVLTSGSVLGAHTVGAMQWKLCATRVLGRQSN